MALTELQAAVARLCTDPAARALLREDPEAFARAAALVPAELAALTGAAWPTLAAFATSLLRKRTREAGQAIPFTRAALGETFARTFEAYAATGASARDPALDALAFLGWLRRRPAPSPALRAATRYEQASLEMRRGRKLCRLGFFTLSRGRPFLACWWRFPRRAPCRSWQWPPPHKSRLPSGP
jgi:hypothetical protein